MPNEPFPREPIPVDEYIRGYESEHIPNWRRITAATGDHYGADREHDALMFVEGLQHDYETARDDYRGSETGIPLDRWDMVVERINDHVVEIGRSDLRVLLPGVFMTHNDLL